MLRTTSSLLAILATAILVTGCASPGPRFTEYHATLAPPAEGMGRIWFYRKSAMFGDALVPRINLDNIKVGKTVPGTYFQLETTPGLHKVSVTTESTKEVVVNVTTNENSYVQFYLVPGVFVGRVVPTVVPEYDALRGIEKLTLVK